MTTSGVVTLEGSKLKGIPFGTEIIERLNREIRCRARVVGCFPDGNSALMPVCARLRHVAGTQWSNKKYMNMEHLEVAAEDTSVAG